MSLVVELGDREQLHDIAQAGGIGDVLRGDARDALPVHVVGGDTRIERDRGEDRAFRRRVEPVDVRGRVGLRVAEALRLGERLVEPPAALRHLGEDVVRRAVHDAEHPGDPIARERFAQRTDQGDAAGDRGLEGQVGRARMRRGLQLGAGAREQLLVPGDDGPARGEGSEHERPRRLKPAEQLEDDVHIRVIHDRDAVGGEDVGDQGRIACTVEIPHGDAGDLESDSGTPRDRVAVLRQRSRHGRADGPASEHADPYDPFAHAPPSPRIAGAAAASHGVPSMTSSRSMSSASSRRIHNVARPSRTPTTAGRPNRL